MKDEPRRTLPSLAAIVEAILFATDRPVTLVELGQAVPEADEESLLSALEELERDYEQSPLRGVSLEEVAGGYQILTRGEVGAYVERFLVGKRRARLSRAALETLATIAYRQPITRGEVEELRGVDAGHVIQRLLERDLIAVRGRSEALGRPLLYATTTEFLRYFGIHTLSDLPSLEEFEALTTADPLDDPEIREALEEQGLWPEAGTPETGAIDVDAEFGGDVDGEMEIDDLLRESPATLDARPELEGTGAESVTAEAHANGHAGSAGVGNGNGHHDEGAAAGNGNGHHDEAAAAGNGNGHHDGVAAGNGGHRAAGRKANGRGRKNGAGKANGGSGSGAEDEMRSEDRDARTEGVRAEENAFVSGAVVSAEFAPAGFGGEDESLDAELAAADAEDEGGIDETGSPRSRRGATPAGAPRFDPADAGLAPDEEDD